MATTPTLALFALCSLFFAFPAQAQWQSVTYTLKGGWNAIYLHGDASYTNPDVLFAAHPEVMEVWRWNPNPEQMGLTQTPLIPPSPTPEWSIWKSEVGPDTLTEMVGQSAYLVKCSGTISNTYSVPIIQVPVPPSSTWVINGANLHGFPTKQNGNYPTYTNYFATFPAAIAANTQIFKYIGGDLGPANPMKIFSTSGEFVDRNSAYWFSAEVVGDFYAPLDITLSNTQGIDFGRSGSVITARVRNRSGSAVTLKMTPVGSGAAPVPAPPGYKVITGDVPITRRTYDGGTQLWTDTLITGEIQQDIPPNATVEIYFGVERPSMSGADGDLYASILRLEDAGNLMQVDLPVRATVASLAGLWVGDATITDVGSQVVTSPGTTLPADSTQFKLRYLLHIDEAGQARVLSQVFLGKLASAGNPTGLCTSESRLKQDEKATALRMSAAHLPIDRVIAGAGGVALPGDLTCTVAIPYNDPTNPFLHTYHPDHDSRDARPDGTDIPLGNGVESYSVTRNLTFSFTASPPPGEGVDSAGWGSSIIGGTYAESLAGLHRNPLTTSGTFILRRVSEIGSITTTP